MANNFLRQCKQNYIDGITPLDKSSFDKEGYKNLVFISQEYFNNERYKDFSGFFMEGQYFVALWAAHLLLEYGKPSNSMIRTAIRVIANYSDNPLAPKVAEEERKWLNANSKKYNEYL